MTPVISPWVFYLMPVANKLGVIAVVALTVLIIVYVIMLVWYFICCDIDDDVCDGIKKAAKKLIVPLAVSVLVYLAIPSSTTITKMLIAQNVTYDRVEAAADTVQSVYEDIMELFGEDEE